MKKETRPKTAIATTKADADVVFDMLVKYGAVRINNICVLELCRTKNAKRIKNLGKEYTQPKGTLQIRLKKTLYLKNKLQAYARKRTK